MNYLMEVHRPAGCLYGDDNSYGHFLTVTNTQVFMVLLFDSPSYIHTHSQYLSTAEAHKKKEDIM